MIQLQSFIFCITFTSAIMGSSGLFVDSADFLAGGSEPIIALPSSEQRWQKNIKTIYYGAINTEGEFAAVTQQANNSMHRYYAEKTLLTLAAQANLAISAQDKLFVSGIMQQPGQATLYRLQQQFSAVTLAERELYIRVDDDDSIAIIAGMFEHNLSITSDNQSQFVAVTNN